MNNCSFYGRMTKDPDVRRANGKNGEFVIAGFSVAVKLPYSRESTFINVKALGKTAETIEKYFRKGSRIAFTAYYKEEKWKDKDGREKSMPVFYCERIEFVDTKAEAPATDATAPSRDNDYGFSNIPDGFDEELPFT